MNTPHEENSYTLPTSRIETLSDGVFAIVMTILVIDLQVPAVAKDATSIEFAKSFLPIWKEFFHYFISFIILGVYWDGHHKQFHYIQHSDRRLLWLNILFLMFISLVPFSTSLLGHYPDQHMPIVFYSIHLTIVALLLFSKWSYATTDHHLVRKNLAQNIILRGKRKILTGITIYVLTIVVSFWSVGFAILLFMLVPLLYLLPGERNTKT